MATIKKISLAFLSVLLSLQVVGARTLFNRNGTPYKIVLDADASESERFAVKELSESLRKVSDFEFPVVGTGQGEKNRRIIVGYNADLQSVLPSEERPADNDESFTYCSVGGDILIWGGRNRGTMFGVYAFLENELGCRWLTSDSSVMPWQRSYWFSGLYCHEAPYIADRCMITSSSGDVVWAARHRLNSVWAPDADGSGPWTGSGIGGFDSCHTFQRYVPSSVYFEEHPEYFSMVDGVRIKDFTQLCLTNPDVLRLCIEGVRNTMRTDPHPIIDLSQNDSSPCCQCPECTALADSLGNQTDLLMWFLNQVADAVRDEFPDKLLGTLAYIYTVEAPKTVAPRDNIVIRLCTGDNCLLHPIAECPADTVFMENIDRWSKMAKHLYIWDYVATFRQYHVPYPFAYSIAPNIRMFKQHNAMGVLELTEYQGPGGQFQELKGYLIAKLLWNPDQDVNAIVNDFIDNYYAEASKGVREYFDYVHSLAELGIHEPCFTMHYETHLYSDEYIRNGLKLAERVETMCQDPVTLRRVRLATMPMYYIHARLHPAEGLRDGTLERIRNVVETEGITYLSEWGDVKNMYQLEYMMNWDAGLIE